MMINGKEIDAKQYRNDWALALMSQGVIVRLSISRWRATAPLNIEDLGLKFSDKDGIGFMRKYIELGREKLLPPNVLSEIENVEARARLRLKESSFDTVWGYFVPYTAFEEWERENDSIRRDFMEAARRLGERYEEIIMIIRDEYRKMAKDVWMRLYQDQGAPTESFIENFVSKIIAKIPSKIDIVSSFKYEVTYFVIPMPSMIEDNISKAQQIKMEREAKQFESELEKNTKKKISEEYIKRKQELIDGFLEATVVSMRKYVAELCDEILRSMSIGGDKKDLSKVQKNKIKRVIKKINLLNFQNDSEINGLLKELEIEIDKFKGERNGDVIAQKLQEIVDMGAKEFIPTDFNPAIEYMEV